MVNEIVKTKLYWILKNTNNLVSQFHSMFTRWWLSSSGSDELVTYLSLIIPRKPTENVQAFWATIKMIYVTAIVCVCVPLTARDYDVLIHPTIASWCVECVDTPDTAAGISSNSLNPFKGTHMCSSISPSSSGLCFSNLHNIVDAVVKINCIECAKLNEPLSRY